MLSHAELLLERGNAQQALPLLVEQCEKTPRDAHAWFLLGACNHQANRLEAALQALERALSIEPRHIQARCAKGAVLCDLGRSQEALSVYRKALHLAPADAQLLLNMGIVLERMGDQNAALERYDLALRHHPEFASALLNRGSMLIRLGRLQDALDNNRRLVGLYPEWEHAQFNLGESLMALSRWEEGLAAYERAVALNPRSAKAHFSAGLALAMLKRFDRARQEFLTTQVIDPAAFDQFMRNAAVSTGAELHQFTPEVIYLLKESARLDVCDWGNWNALVADFGHQVGHSSGQTEKMAEPALAFRAGALPISGDASLELAKNVAVLIAEKVASFPPFAHETKHAGKVRIGYVSPDFRSHPIATVTRRLYALHDRERFEVYGYSLHPGDNSEVRRDIEQGCDVFRELSGVDDRAAAETIHRDGIDILIDLAGYTRFSRPEIFAMRPAPLQASYLGMLQTTGADFIDYFMADPVVVPAATTARFFAEKIAYLPNSYFLFDNRLQISPQQLTREELGLPAHGFVFCCHNSSYKITPVDLDIWMRLLKRVPGSVLWLYKSSAEVEANLRREAESRGVEPHRLVFANQAPHATYLARYRMADLFLDTAFYNAQTTAAEALWAGLPVLTCPGVTMASRVASGLLHAIGLEEMIAGSPQQYEECAYRLATHANELAQVRERLANRRLSATLFDTERQVRNLESAYQAMWQRHQSGLAPESFQVADLRSPESGNSTRHQPSLKT
ncbi:O-linked N-acetylglucosamine transferase family protein [Sideroxydans lithotrophicus]|uniref:protein O-GlcNAc transferase n=1 Tax=Sideroxydans lithotrophicus (strain ES-1) TaxID=580332 RepID=D5CUQ1_SIDLE|nr:tetratricopeptide repeat protein [Sideroxydans lithotrophicus]ADE12438.1 TPR repeat-containing protein [Sideroxydans lithotrophicus ES-1]